MASTLTSRTLDLRSLDAAARAARVLAAFDALGEDSVELLAADDLGSVLESLCQTRPGRFEWSPLEAGPELHRVALARRQTGTGARCVTEALGWDHDRLEELERAAFAERGRRRFAEAAASYAAFALGLRRHIGFEEELLFPEFERRSGISADGGPTAVMRSEHRELEALLAAVERGIGDPNADLDDSRRQFHELLADHNLKEERILYPGTDRLMASQERDELVRRIQAYRR